VAELDKYRRRLGGLDQAERGAVEALTRSLLAKLLHDPTVGLKEAAGSAQGEELAEAVRILFNL
jgi:glutamyl-tRNA reductase